MYEAEEVRGGVDRSSPDTAWLVYSQTHGCDNLHEISRGLGPPTPCKGREAGFMGPSTPEGFIYS